jgi:hypothetical protein
LGHVPVHLSKQLLLLLVPGFGSVQSCVFLVTVAALDRPTGPFCPTLLWAYGLLFLMGALSEPILSRCHGCRGVGDLLPVWRHIHATPGHSRVLEYTYDLCTYRYRTLYLYLIYNKTIPTRRGTSGQRNLSFPSYVYMVSEQRS